MEPYMIWVWLAVVVISLIIEFFSASLTSLWFAVGGVISIILAIPALKIDILIQIIVFVSVSFICLISLRKFAVKWLYGKKQEKTNTDAIIGTNHTLKGNITEEENGTIKINGVIWTCIAENSQTEIKEGTIVTIKEIRGNKLIVAPEKKEK